MTTETTPRPEVCCHSHVGDVDRQRPHSHGFGSVQLRLGMTLVGAMFIFGAYMCDWIVFKGRKEPGALCAFFGAIILGAPIIYSAFDEIRQGRLHLSLLVALAVMAAFSQSDYRTAGIVAFFMLMATLIEERTALGARLAVEGLLRLTPTLAERKDGSRVAAHELKPGDVIIVRPGDNIPADGIIVAGTTTVNQATITGESMPEDKEVGSEVFAGTVNLTGAADVRVTRAGDDTTLGKVRNMILQAEQTRTPIMQIIDEYAQWYTPVVLMIAAIIWVFTGKVDRAITALVVTCPCALVLATPTAMVAALSCAARLGILVKNVAHLESASRITAILFDKTGTLTTGQLAVTRLSPLGQTEPAHLLKVAASVESNSNHPIAKAVVSVAERANVPILGVDDFTEAPGRGVMGRLEGKPVMIGRRNWLEEKGADFGSVTEEHEREIEGISVLYVAQNGKCIGWIGLEDKARPEAKEANRRLQQLGVRRLAMVTGDRWSVANHIAAELGCTEVQAECLPEMKLQIVHGMRREGYQVAVVGDGVNDAPALAAGDLGVAMGAAGSDIAINSASIALMSSDLSRLPFLIELSRKLRAVVYQNLIFGVIFVAGGLTLSGLGYLTPIVAAILHNFGSFGVIFNSARLVRFAETLQPYRPKEQERAVKPQPVAA